MNVYTITPSWVIETKKEFLDGVKTLESWGLHVVNREFSKVIPSPKEKAAELHRAFKDASIDFILARRGGASSMKMLPFVDFDLIRRHPKPLAGFSDLSTLLNSIHERTGMITLHSPMVLNFTDPTRFTIRSFKNALNGFPNKSLFSGAPVKVYREGKARGTLKGGNLVTLSTLIGTPWDVPTKGAVVFLEDVDEKPHEVDRYLSMWILAGKFKGIKGLIIGDFRGVKPADVLKTLTDQMTMPFPVVYCPYIGHVKNKITLPVGAAVELDTRKGTLEIQ